MDAPMEERDFHRVARGLRCSRSSVGRMGEVRDGFGDAIKNDADAHAAAEQHRDPCAEFIVRNGIIWPQSHASQWAGGEEEEENDEDAHAQQIEPADILDDPRITALEQSGGLLGKNAGKYDESDSDNGRAEECDRGYVSHRG